MIKILSSILVVCCVGFLNYANAEDSSIYIKMGEARTKKSLVAFPALQYFGSPTSSSKFQAIGAEIFNVVTNDLTFSSYFQFIKPTAFLEDTAKASLLPASGQANGFKFDKWSAIGADFLIKAGFSIAGDEITLETYTYHVSLNKLILGKKYKGRLASVRRLAHTFTNDVLKALTGKEGMFLSRIAVSSDRIDGKAKEIFVMDWDGSNVIQVTNHRSISLSPAWSPDGKKIAYTAYVKRVGAKFRNADLLLLDLPSGQRSLVSYRQGINSGASFSPDGKSIFLTISQGTNPDIYKINYDGSLSAKITNGPAGAMNVEPNISADGKKIIFSSDRAGRPMIYTADIDGSDVKRLTYAGVFNSSPSVSPDAKKIAFAGQSEDHFDIFVMDADGTNMIRLTSAKKKNGKFASNEDPSFSPDGRFVMYTSNRSGKNQIFVSTIDGSEERQITSDEHNYFKPRWSKNVE
jgi:TolB protein